MEKQRIKKPIWLYILRWTARIVVLLLFAFFFKEFLRTNLWERDLPQGMITFPPVENFFFVYFIAFFIGFWREWLAGLICLLAFVIFILLFPYIVLLPIGIITLIIPGILYFLSWYYHRRYGRQQQQ
jgi:hypothetical protein